MRDSFKKIKTIVKAFTESLPEDQDWYKKRIAACNSCEFNTKNISRENLKAKDKLKLDLHACPEGDHCTICGCCTHRKSSQKTENCALLEIGETPKWIALEVESSTDDKVSITNYSNDIGDLIREGNLLIFDAGEVDKERIDFKIGIKRKGVFELKNVRIGCKCTVAEPEKISETEYHFNIALSTKDFRSSANIERSFTIEYYGKKKEPSEMTIKIKLKKK